MGENFFIQEVNNQDYPIIVQSVDDSRLDDYILDVSTILKDKSFKGTVLLDMLTSNGPDDRFFSIYFNGKAFEYSSIRFQNELPSSIVKVSNKFYAQNKNLLRNCAINEEKILCEKFSMVE